MSGSIDVTTTIYISDIMDEVSDQDLLAEMESRKIGPVAASMSTDDIEELHGLIMQGQKAAALSLIDSFLFAKHPGALKHAYDKAVAAQGPH